MRSLRRYSSIAWMELSWYTNKADFCRAGTSGAWLSVAASPISSRVGMLSDTSFSGALTMVDGLPCWVLDFKLLPRPSVLSTWSANRGMEFNSRRSGSLSLALKVFWTALKVGRSILRITRVDWPFMLKLRARTKASFVTLCSNGSNFWRACLASHCMVRFMIAWYRSSLSKPSTAST